MSYTKHMILVLSLLMFTVAVTFSQAPVELGGSSGLSLLNSLAKSSQDQANDTLNQTNDTINQTNDTINATNNTTDVNGTVGIHSAAFLSWGTKPKSHNEFRSVNNSSESKSGADKSSSVTSPPDTLAMTDDLKDLNALAEKNAFATA